MGLRAAALAAGTLAFAAVVTLAVAMGGSGDRVRTVEVGIHHSRFHPAVMEVKRGTTVRFVITNTDPIDHEFILGNRGVQKRHEKGTEAHHGAKPGEVSVPAGGTAETTYTFSEPGVVLLGCHLPGHYAYGMRGRIQVG